MRKVLTAVFVLGLLLSVAQPAQAECGLARLIRSISPTGFSYIQTPGVVPTIGTSSSVTTGAAGSFWILGNGDPTAHPAGDEQGVDSGSWPAVEGGYGYYYYGWVTFGLSPYAAYAYSAAISGTWAADGRIDGCPDPVPNACIAVLISDQHDGVGYFAMITKARDLNGNYELTQAGNAPYDLVQIPKLAIDDSNTVSPSLVSLLVTGPDAASLAAGLYLDGGCPSPIAGYKVRAQNIPEGGGAPSDRARDAWTEVSGTVPLGTQTSVEVGCTGNTDVYLATSVVFDSGYELELVGENSTRVACGPTIADPADLQPKKPAHKPGRKTKR
jgi:hypothetical protein